MSAAATSLDLLVESPDGSVESRRFGEREAVWLGRDPSCQLVLDSTLVSRRHARIERVGAALRLRDQSVNGTEVDGELLHHRERRVERAKCLLRIGPFRVLVRAPDSWPAQARVASPAAPAEVAAAAAHGDGRGAGGGPAGVPIALRRRIQRELLDHLDLARLDADRPLQGERLRPQVETALGRICDALGPALGDSEQRRTLCAELVDEAVALGPLTSLLADPEVSEIMVVDPSTIYVERRGVIVETTLHFTDAEAVRAVIERIVTPLGRRIDESAPLCDARLPDGSRVNAIIPPLASRGPCITIRKFESKPLRLPELVRAGSLSPEMAELLIAAVRCRKNIVISGGTGSGKTTLLNVLSAAIPERERIVTIEDAAELRLHQKHVVGLESKPANLEGKGAYSIRDLVRNALRMRPDRIVVGECRGGEALDMLQAMNTGHEGSMTTTHANSPSEALARLETLCLMAGLELPIAAIRHQLAASLHLVVQQTRFADGARRVTSICEVCGVDLHGEVALQEIFGYARATPDAGSGAFLPTGHLPSFAAELEASQANAAREAPDAGNAPEARQAPDAQKDGRS